VRVLETHLAGVVPAGGDVLELLEADRDVGELDGEGYGGVLLESEQRTVNSKQRTVEVKTISKQIPARMFFQR
jgi:hypothetical protein